MSVRTPLVRFLIASVLMLGCAGTSSAPAAEAAPVAEPPAAASAAEGGITWKPIPAGTFTMGCTTGDRDCGSELPHAVTITRAFLMAETETTNGSYRLCVSSGACRAPKEWVGGENEPVVNVEKSDAVSFCAWAGGRLPTEAEWEYAARGGRSGLIYPNGNTISHDDANYSGTGGRDQWEEVAPVRSFPPNGYGLYDMAGNVWEWVSDWYGSYRPGPAVDPMGPAPGDGSLNRGGSWYGFPSFLRVSHRVSAGFELRFDYGFRCVREGAR